MLAYKDEDEIKKYVEESEYTYTDWKGDNAVIKYTDYQVFNNDGAQAYAFWNKQVYVIAFRGTEPTQLSDVFADMKVWKTESQVDGRVHYGFKKELNKIWSDIKECWPIFKDRRLYVTGHSLGAAMATLAASRLNKGTCVPTVYTFGCPRVGNKKFIESCTFEHHRFVNNNDAVTKVPFWFLGFRHSGDLNYINYYGNIRPLTPWQKIKDQFRGRVRALSKFQLFDGIFDHSVTLYYQKLERISK
jgi:triacylglycerol lipase